MTDSYYELLDAADPLGEKFCATDFSQEYLDGGHSARRAGLGVVGSRTGTLCCP
jgi:hypothetical protein